MVTEIFHHFGKYCDFWWKFDANTKSKVNMKASKSISLEQRQEGPASLVMFKDKKKKSLHILKSLLQQFLKELCHIAYTLLLTDI